MQQTVIVDYGSGNLHSALKAFERVISERGLDMSVAVSADAGRVREADRVVLPGVGAFASCYEGLQAVDGMVRALEESVLEAKRPFLGICVGMQLLASGSEEFGETPGLGWIPGVVRKIAPRDDTAKVPHMGWNRVTARAEESGTASDAPPHPVLPSTEGEPDHAYFVHSYHMQPADRRHILAVTAHGGSEIVAAIGRDNIAGVQFHPEKSQRYGLDLIGRFLVWDPARREIS